MRPVPDSYLPTLIIWSKSFWNPLNHILLHNLQNSSFPIVFRGAVSCWTLHVSILYFTFVDQPKGSLK
jgi:hypothetical protein